MLIILLILIYREQCISCQKFCQQIFCRGDVSVCQSKLIAANSKFANKTITDELYDSNHKLLEKCSSSGCIKYDSNERKAAKYSLNGKLMEEYDTEGNIITKYDDEGNLRYAKNIDGSAYWYDANHNIIGAKKTSPFTPAEAAALIKKGNNNKVTLTFK